MLLLILLLVVTSARFVLRGVMHVLCIEFLVSDCLACVTADVIKRASRSVVRQVPGGRCLSAYAVFLALFEKLGQDGPR